MFIADLSYAGLGEHGALLLDQAKLGVLCGSVISAIIGCILLHKTLPQSKLRTRPSHSQGRVCDLSTTNTCLNQQSGTNVSLCFPLAS